MTTELSYTIDHVQMLQKELEAAKQQELELLAVNSHITEAATALIERWETPLWKDVKPTGVFIYALRDAINIEPSKALREHEAKVKNGK